MAFSFGIKFKIWDEYSSQTSKIDKALGKINSKLGVLQKKATSATNSLQTGLTGLDIAGKITQPFQAALDETIGFERQMSKVQAVTQKTKAEMLALTEQAIDLSSKTKFTAKEVGEGMEFLARAGFNEKQIKGSIQAMLNLSAATDTALGKTADIASNIAGAFNLEASEKNMNKLADTLAVVTAKSNTNLLQLGEAFKKGAPVAKILNVSIEEMAAVIGVLGDRGIQGGAATRTLSSALLGLGKPTDKAQKAINQLGLKIFELRDGKKEFVGFPKLIQQLTDKFEGLGKDKVLGALSDIFGKNAARNIATLAGATKDFQGKTLASGAAIKKLTEQLDTASGAASKMATVMQDNLGGDIDTAKSRISALGIRIGQQLTPILRKLAASFISITDVLIRFVQTPAGKTITKITLAIAGLIAAFGGMVAAKAGIALLVAQLRILGLTAAKTLIPLLPYIAVIGAIAGAVYVGVKAWKAYNNVLLGISKPTTGFTGVLQKIGAALHGFAKGFMAGVMPIKKIALDTFTNLKEIINDVVRAFQGSETPLSNSKKSLLSIAAIGEKIGRVIGVVAKLFATEFFTKIRIVINLIGGLFSGIGVMFNKFIKPAFNDLMSTFGKLFSEILGLFGVTTKKTGDFGGILKTVGMVANVLGRIIGFVVGGAITLLIRRVQLVINIWRIGIAVIKAVIGVIKAIGQAFVWLGGVAVDGIMMIWNVAKTGLTAIGAYFQTMFGVVKTVFTAIGAFWSTFLPSKGEGFMTWLMNLPSRWLEAGKSLVQALIDGIMSMWSKLKSTVGDVVNIIPSRVRGFIGIGSDDETESKPTMSTVAANTTGRTSTPIQPNFTPNFNVNNNITNNATATPVMLDGKKVGQILTDVFTQQDSRK